MRLPLRGEVFFIELDESLGRKPFVVISNNQRNRNLHTALGARITTTAKHSHQPSVVALSSADPVTGFVVCDDVTMLYRDELASPSGALSPRTMLAVNEGLKIALALP